MRRREFITLIGSASVAWPRAALAQQPGRVRRIGVLMSVAETDPASQSEVAAFRGALSNLGWTEGDNVRIELRWGAGDADKIRTLAKELVDLRPDAILGRNTPVIAALARAIARRVGATENSFWQVAMPRPFAPRVAEPQRQNPARYRSRSLRRRNRRAQVVLGA
jgi:ABC-type uncharacterized transport system substrate-binding protein